MKDSRKWARLVVCVAFHMIFVGLAESILTYVLEVERPGPILFLPSLAAAALIGWFYTHDRTGSRITEAANLAGALTAVRFWTDITYLQPSSGVSLWSYFTVWFVWCSYVANILAILGMGYLTEHRRAIKPSVN